MNEEDLINGLKQGSREAQEEFVKRYSGFLFNVTLHVLRRKDLAEDAAEDALLTGIQKIGSFKGKSKLSTWLYRIAANRAKQMILKEVREDSLKRKLVKSSVAEDYVPSEYKNNREKEIIWRGMGFLSDKEREIIALIDIEGLKYEEAAELLGVPIGTVRSRISRAREHLKKVILERNFFDINISNE